MLFCHLGRAYSLREVIGGLQSCEGKLKHLGITASRRFALAYANEHRPWSLYQELFLIFLHRFRDQGIGNKKSRLKKKLVSLDSTIIDLSISLFDWAHFRRSKGAIKLPLLLGHDGYLSTFAWIPEGKVTYIQICRQVAFPPGTIVVDDRAYNDYRLFAQWISQGIHFVIKMKENALYELIGDRAVSQNRNILANELIQLTGYGARQKCSYPLRRIEVYDPKTEEVHTFLTNHMDWGPITIAAIYKERWKVEIFFKYLKQNLKIKTFAGISANAVKIPIWTALIAMLLLRYIQLVAQFAWSLSNWVALPRMNLFTHRDLCPWLNRPYETLPTYYEPQQLLLNL